MDNQTSAVYGLASGLNKALGTYFGGQIQTQQRQQELNQEIQAKKDLMDYQSQLDEKNAFKIPGSAVLSLNPEFKGALDPEQSYKAEDIEKMMKLFPKKGKETREAELSGQVFPVAGLDAYFPDSEEAAKMKKELSARGVSHIPREMVDALRDKVYGATNADKSLYEKAMGPNGLTVNDPVSGTPRAATPEEAAQGFADFQDTLKKATKGKTIPYGSPEMKDLAVKSILAYERLTDKQKMASTDAINMVTSKLAQKGYSQVSIRRILQQVHSIGWNAHFDAQGNQMQDPSMMDQMQSFGKSMIPSFMMKGNPTQPQAPEPEAPESNPQ